MMLKIYRWLANKNREEAARARVQAGQRQQDEESFDWQAETKNLEALAKKNLMVDKEDERALTLQEVKKMEKDRRKVEEYMEACKLARQSRLDRIPLLYQ